MDESSIDVDGTRLHIVSEGPGPTVVLLHEWLEYSWSWRRLDQWSSAPAR